MHAPRGGDEPVRRLTSARKPPGLSQPYSSARPAPVRGGFLVPQRVARSHPPLDPPPTGWTPALNTGYAEDMKSEEILRYEEEFRAMREMFGTYFLELGTRAPGAEAPAGECGQKSAQSHDSGLRPNGDPIPPVPPPDGDDG